MKRYVKPSKSSAEVQRIQELRRSSASSKHKSKKAYSRKPKYAGEIYG